MYAIKTEKLTKSYGTSRGICDVDLAVKEGDFFGFIGPNGAGKSTTIRTLLGLIEKTSGEAFVLGKDITKSRTEILSRVGYLPSDTAFYGGMKVSDMLEFSAKLRKLDCKAEAIRLAERLELDLGRKISELSFGNRKKVGIILALQHKPSLYILDEPTSGLDPLMQREFYSILKERNEEGATVFLSSHVLSEIGRYCKSAGVIRDGKILVADSVKNLAHTGIKKVSLSGVLQIPAIESAKNIKLEGDLLTFLYDKSPENLVKELGKLRFSDINITDPDLEEVFMHYYADGTNEREKGGAVK